MLIHIFILTACKPNRVPQQMIKILKKNPLPPQELLEKSNETRAADVPAAAATDTETTESEKITVISGATTDKMDTDESIPESAATASDAKPADLLDQSTATTTTAVTTKEIADEMDLDFEEISDGELEEEARIRGLGDALGVDWASLVAESKAIAKERAVVKETTAKQRWQPHRILLDVGVSFRMAGKEFASNVLNQAHRRLKEEEEKLTAAARAEDEGLSSIIKGVTIKKEMLDEPIEQNVDGFAIKEIKEEEQAVATVAVGMAEPPPIIEEELLIHPIACVQVASRVNAEQRRNLVFNATGPYSRALSARRDIQMRRQLCGLPIKQSWSRLGGGPKTSATNPSYAQIAKQLFEKALAKVN